MTTTTTLENSGQILYSAPRKEERKKRMLMGSTMPSSHSIHIISHANYDELTIFYEYLNNARNM
jgi:hypothetical protein